MISKGSGRSQQSGLRGCKPHGRSGSAAAAADGPATDTVSRWPLRAALAHSLCTSEKAEGMYSATCPCCRAHATRLRRREQQTGVFG